MSGHTSSPLVSIVIPCHNQARYLGEAIESALNQTHPAIEIVVVDDGSTDGTRAVAARYPGVTLVSQANHGLARARNAGLRRMTGTHVIFLDADDRLRPAAAETGLAHLQGAPAAACCFGRCIVITSAGVPCPTDHAPGIGGDAFAALLRHNPIRMPALALHRRGALLSAGGFDPGRHASADYDLYLRLARRFPMLEHDEIVAEYRRHDESMSNDTVLMLTSTLAVMRAQRRHARSSPERREAYREGMRFWQTFYGEPVVQQLRADLRAARWSRALMTLLTLTRRCPGFSARTAWRALIHYAHRGHSRPHPGGARRS